MKVEHIYLPCGNDSHLPTFDFALECAVYGGSLETVQKMIKQGANPLANNLCCLKIAKQQNLTEIVNYLENFIKLSKL
jgi:hypothetical protein